MVQAWRLEFADSLPAEELIGLSRGIHAGNPEALVAWETIRVEEEAYLQKRAERRSG